MRLEQVPVSVSMSSPPSTLAASIQQPPGDQPASAATGPWVHPASVQTLVLPEGIYGFSVPGGRPDERLDGAPLLARHQLRLPSMQIGTAPTPQAAQVELFPAPGTLDRWLSQPGDQLTVRVHGGEVAMLLTSVRRQSDKPLSINVVRLDQPQPVAADQSPLRILLHVQMLGDLFYSLGPAGPVHHGLSVEAFVVDCKDAELGHVVEYRGETADGFETPWLSEGMLCGSRGRGVPLLAFSVRPRVRAARGRTVACRGYFHKAGWVEADATEDWCRSPLPDDPLEGMELTLADLA